MEGKIHIPEAAKLHCCGLDQEHQQIADYINTAAERIQKGEALENRQVLDDMIDLFARHFRHEEAAMRRVAYPDLPRHSAHHAEIIATLKAARANGRGSGFADRDGLGQLFALLIDDVLRADLGFKAFIEGKGLGDCDNMTG